MGANADYLIPDVLPTVNKPPPRRYIAVNIPVRIK
jgi:hypothetical protein|tara:strand:+ start:509 stop:613 length:105 start_codon:yes stop_codon:yes gene_type:complete